MTDTYICEMCGGKFEKGQSDKEAEDEMKKLWGNVPKEELSIICDDCFNKIHPAKFPIAAKIAKAALEQKIKMLHGKN